jgi:hypothetical protein
MNERILELVYKSTVPADQVEHYTESKGLIVPDEKLDVAKFAELIVRECLDIAKNWDDQLVNAKLVKESNAVGIVVYRIARQFGVKE